MINEEYLDKQAQPIVNEYQEYELYYLDEISKGVNEVIHDEKFLTLNDTAKATLLTSLANNFIKRLNTKSKKVSTNTAKIINKTYTNVINASLEDIAYIAKHNNIDPIALGSNDELKAILSRVGKKSINDLYNLSNTTALGTYLDIGSGNKQWLNTRQTYINIIDKAIIDASSGNISGSQALRQSLKSLSQQGLQYVYYDNGKPYRRNIVSAARMNIQDGMRNVAQQSSDYAAQKYGADGKEISVHGNCAPDHIHIQGKQYTNKDYERMNSNLNRRVSTKNCRHIAFNILIGVSTPNYSSASLNAINEQNNKGWTDTNNILNGTTKNKHYTLCEASQQLRRLENSTKKSLIEERMLKNAGFTKFAKIAKQQATKHRSKHKLLVAALEPFGVMPDNSRFII